ncbi:TerD family protein [Candidatus Woesebacteria bacterium]|nr:TerD family protein [Candidatus Woesebacteria bacterium]
MNATTLQTNVSFDVLSAIIKRTLRVPQTCPTAGNGAQIARQLDTALLSVGFKLSGALLQYLSTAHPVEVKQVAHQLIQDVRDLVGDNFQHNVYFREFPKNVPDTYEFWLGKVVELILTGQTSYGSYQQSYQDMLAAHEEFLPSIKDRVTVLHLGGDLVEEAEKLFVQLAGSTVPVNVEDRRILAELAEFVSTSSPDGLSIPNRENKAIVNAVRFQLGFVTMIDTPTDFLRMAAHLSGSDVTLAKPPRFKSFARQDRAMLLMSLHWSMFNNEEKLADVLQHREMWKRLGEKLHPHDYPKWHLAAQVFDVAWGRFKNIRSHAGKVEAAFARGDVREAITLLAQKPGMLFRSLDRILGLIWSSQDINFLVGVIGSVATKVSGRVIMQVREHLKNRMSTGQDRVFVNKAAKAWVKPEDREPLRWEVVEPTLSALDKELTKRMHKTKPLLVDPQVLNVALPLSEKTKAAGFNVLPRGSFAPIKGSLLRFFAYWKQKEYRTDFDLSVALLDESFALIDKVSWTSLKTEGCVHSGDLTTAPNGATEFIEVDLNRLPNRCKYIVPMVLVFRGENFQEVEESLFGYMELEPEQRGKPFEPRTVRTKCDMRGEGKVAMPLAFSRLEDGSWEVTWLHLYQTGNAEFNMVEQNRLTLNLLVKGMLERRFTTVGDILHLMATDYKFYYGWSQVPGDSVFIGLEAPAKAEDGATIITLSNLSSLIPE